jgi:hypothetical protein
MLSTGADSIHMPQIFLEDEEYPGHSLFFSILKIYHISAKRKFVSEEKSL